MKNNPADAINDSMWNHLKTRGQQANPETAEQLVEKILQALAWGGDPYTDKDSVYSGKFEKLASHAAMELLAIVLDPRWERVKEVIEIGYAGG